MERILLRFLHIPKRAQLLGWLSNTIPKRTIPSRTISTLPPKFATISNPPNSASSLSTDPLEQSFFRSTFADQWWDPNFIPVLHAMNRLRVPLVRDAYVDYNQRGREAVQKELRESAYPLKGAKILDVGSGGGILSEALVRLGGEVTGIDVVEENVQAARRHWESGKQREEETKPPGTLVYQLSTVEALASLQPAHYDMTVASEVIEHVADVDSFLDGMAALTRPGGTIVLTTINRTFASFALAIVWAEHLARFIPRGTHQWSKFVRVKELRDHLVRRGFDVRRTQGWRYNPRNNQWSWWTSDAAFYVMVAVKAG